MRRGLMTLCVTATALAAVVEVASACSCAPPEKVFKSAEVAFEGRLVDMEGKTVSYAVDRVYRQSSDFPVAEGDEVTVHFFSSLCGGLGPVGETYVVMPYPTPGGYAITSCGSVGVRKLAEVTRDSKVEPKPTRTAGGRVACEALIATAGREIGRAF